MQTMKPKATFLKTLVQVDKEFFVVLFNGSGSNWKVRVGLHVQGETNPREVLEMGTLSGVVDVLDAEHFAGKYIRIKRRDT